MESDRQPESEITGRLYRKYAKDMKEQTFTRGGGDTWMAEFEGFEDVVVPFSECEIVCVCV